MLSFHSSQNDRLKIFLLGESSIVGDENYRASDGIWLPESNDPKKALVFPEQVKINCYNTEKVCREQKVILSLPGGMVQIFDIVDTDWQIVSWDTNGLVASYSSEVSKAVPLSERCHNHVLTMSFASGAVSTSDIPTHEKGCEPFMETDSYKLVRGNYYVDTSTKNNMDSQQ